MAVCCGLRCGGVKEKGTAETSENIGSMLVSVVRVADLFRNAICYLAFLSAPLSSFDQNHSFFCAEKLYSCFKTQLKSCFP